MLFKSFICGKKTLFTLEDVELLYEDMIIKTADEINSELNEMMGPGIFSYQANEKRVGGRFWIPCIRPFWGKAWVTSKLGPEKYEVRAPAHQVDLTIHNVVKAELYREDSAFAEFELDDVHYTPKDKRLSFNFLGGSVSFNIIIKDICIEIKVKKKAFEVMGIRDHGNDNFVWESLPAWFTKL